MQHWYAFHSDKTMRHTYVSVGTSQIYLTRTQSSLAVGDVIWVIEGSTSTPMTFQLADCFRFESSNEPPFPPGYERFVFKITGASLLPAPLPLPKHGPWFSPLHAKYITKQRFFNRLACEPVVLAGLIRASGAAL